MVSASHHRRPHCKICSFQVRRFWRVQANRMDSAYPSLPSLGGRMEKEDHAPDIPNMS